MVLFLKLWRKSNSKAIADGVPQMAPVKPLPLPIWVFFEFLQRASTGMSASSIANRRDGCGSGAPLLLHPNMLP